MGASCKSFSQGGRGSCCMNDRCLGGAGTRARRVAAGTELPGRGPTCATARMSATSQVGCTETHRVCLIHGASRRSLRDYNTLLDCRPSRQKSPAGIHVETGCGMSISRRSGFALSAARSATAESIAVPGESAFRSKSTNVVASRVPTPPSLFNLPSGPNPSRSTGATRPRKWGPLQRGGRACRTPLELAFRPSRAG